MTNKQVVIYNLIEVDTDLSAHDTQVYVESYFSRLNAANQLQAQYQDVENGLHEDKIKIMESGLDYRGIPCKKVSSRQSKAYTNGESTRRGSSELAKKCQ